MNTSVDGLVDRLPAFVNPDDLPILHLYQLVDVFAHAQIMGDHYPGFVLLMDQVCVELGDLIGSLGVEAGSRFVCQDHAWVVDQ